MSGNSIKDTDFVCPECGMPLAGKDIYAHALTHWVEVLEYATSSKKARDRQEILLNGGITYADYKKQVAEGK